MLSCHVNTVLFYDGATKFQKSSPSCELISSLFDSLSKTQIPFFSNKEREKGRKTPHTTVGGGLRALCIF